MSHFLRQSFEYVVPAFSWLFSWSSIWNDGESVALPHCHHLHLHHHHFEKKNMVFPSVRSLRWCTGILDACLSYMRCYCIMAIAVFLRLQSIFHANQTVWIVPLGIILYIWEHASVYGFLCVLFVHPTAIHFCAILRKECERKRGRERETAKKRGSKTNVMILWAFDYVCMFVFM